MAITPHVLIQEIHVSTVNSDSSSLKDISWFSLFCPLNAIIFLPTIPRPPICKYFELLKVLLTRENLEAISLKVYLLCE